MTTILYVEDDASNIRLIQKMFKLSGYQLSSALNGNDGIRKAIDEKPNLILMDIDLPDIDGLEVTRRLRADVRTRNIPIIALTAHAVAETHEEAINAGCDHFLHKPIGRIDLLKAVQQYLTYVNSHEENLEEETDIPSQ